MSPDMTHLHLSYVPLTPERWSDFETLFGPRGACAGCWCMYWRLSPSQFRAQAGEGNRLNIQALVNSGEVPGLLAYADDQPAGWCSFGPRQAFPTLARSRILKPVDEQPVWSVVCFFVSRLYRRQGLTVGLLNAAAQYARQHGAHILEGYPVVPREGKAPDVFVFTGLLRAFQQAGFVEVARRSPTRPVMRLTL
jgi:GNAT superfamily N-acetyltransferase